MEEDKYQITEKANFINLLLLEDEIKHFDIILSKQVKNISDWQEKLRTTRAVFMTLYNVKDVTNKRKRKINITLFVAKNIHYRTPSQ